MSTAHKHRKVIDLDALTWEESARLVTYDDDVVSNLRDSRRDSVSPRV